MEKLRRGLLVACIVLAEIVLLTLAHFPQAYNFPKIKTKSARLRVIKERFRFTWDAYKKHGMGRDEINPLTGKARKGMWPGTLINSLDTLWLMDMKEEFNEASQVIARVDFTKGNGSASFFEATTRNLGGLISAYDLSGEKIFLDKAIALGDVLLKAFDSPSGYPYMRFDFSSQQPVRSPFSSLAEVGSCQLEFARLSQLTGDDKYLETAFQVYYTLYNAKVGTYYANVNVETGNFTSKAFSFGAKGDSFFEYLIKLNFLLPKDEIDTPNFLTMFSDSIEDMKEHLIKPCYNDHVCLGMTNEKGIFVHETQHLNFQVPGMLLLGAKLLPDQGLDALAIKLLDTFVTIPALAPTGLAPELVKFSQTAPLKIKNPYNALRPELLESLYYAYRHTRDGKYQELAWELFIAFDTYSKTSYGYAEYNDVTITSPIAQLRPYMASYFLAETFKYLLLIFDDSILPQDRWVLNTQAHPFKIIN